MDKKELGQLIGAKREAIGMSQSMLARRVGVSRPYISQIENGQKSASDEVLMMIFAILDIDYTTLLNPEEQNPLNENEQNVLSGGLKLINDLSSLVDEETLTKILLLFNDYQSTIVSALNALEENPDYMAPEGWFDLEKEDRRLVQRIINRLNPNGKE